MNYTNESHKVYVGPEHEFVGSEPYIAPKPKEYLLRYVDWGGGVTLEKYEILKRTPRGAWISVDYVKKRFVLENTHKCFAHASEEKARESFFARKKKQLKILRAQIANIESAVYSLEHNIVEDYHLTFELY